jgi:hypothetical protein
VSATIQPTVQDEEAMEDQEEGEPPGSGTASPAPGVADEARPASTEMPDAEAVVRDEDDELWEADSADSASRVTAPRSPLPPGELPERRVVVIDEDADTAASPTGPPNDPRPDPRSSEAGIADIGATLEDEDTGKRRWRLFRKGGE